MDHGACDGIAFAVLGRLFHSDVSLSEIAIKEGKLSRAAMVAGLYLVRDIFLTPAT